MNFIALLRPCHEAKMQKEEIREFEGEKNRYEKSGMLYVLLTYLASFFILFLILLMPIVVIDIFYMGEYDGP